MLRNIRLIDIIKHIQMIIFYMCINSCESAVDNQLDNVESIDCNNLKIGLIDLNPELVKIEINKLLIDSSPIRTNNDEIGHKINLSVLINHINSQCSEIHAELICYACIDTYPQITELLVTMDSSGVSINRVIDISTPPDANLYFRAIHKVW